MTRRTKIDFVDANDFIARMPAERRARVEARARDLIAEELTLRDLRKARRCTQADVAHELGVGQEQISRLEQRTDMLLSTLAGYIRGMGGDLKLVATFPDRPPVSLAGLADIVDDDPPPPPTRNRRRKRPAAASS